MSELKPAPQIETKPAPARPWRMDIFTVSGVCLVRIPLQPVAPATSEDRALWFSGSAEAVRSGVASRAEAYCGDTPVASATVRAGTRRGDGVWFPFTNWIVGDTVSVDLRIFNIPEGLLS